MATTLIRLFAAVAVLSVPLQSVLAADAAKGRGAVAEACAADLKALCPDVKPGDGRLRECLRDNRKKLSEPCREAMKDQRGKRKSEGQKS